jgi:hypothetical protein
MAGSQSSGVGRAILSEDPRFNGVRVFSATMLNERDQLGERVTRWMRDNLHCDVRDVYVTQSSDEAFHCIAITVFYWEELG